MVLKLPIGPPLLKSWDPFLLMVLGLVMGQRGLAWLVQCSVAKKTEPIKDSPGVGRVGPDTEASPRS
jgi:hypothetical protein